MTVLVEKFGGVNSASRPYSAAQRPASLSGQYIFVFVFGRSFSFSSLDFISHLCNLFVLQVVNHCLMLLGCKKTAGGAPQNKPSTVSTTASVKVSMDDEF